MQYLVLTIKHKWFVFVAGLQVGVPLFRLITHDWTKLLPWNLRAYQEQFFGKQRNPDKFANAWLRHQNAHDHHWEYWIPRTAHNRGGGGDNVPLPMPDAAVCEMIADWMGASKAYEGCWPVIDDWKWLKEARPKMKLHPSTAKRLDFLLAITSIRQEKAGVPNA